MSIRRLWAVAFLMLKLASPTAATTVSNDVEQQTIAQN